MRLSYDEKKLVIEMRNLAGWRDLNLQGKLHPGEIARVLRYRSGKSTRALAREIGVSHQTITNWEHGRKGRVVRQLRHLSGYFHPSEFEHVKNSYGFSL